MFYEHKKYTIKNISPILEINLQILGCYNSTPLKMNLVLEIWLVLTQTTEGVIFLNPLLFPRWPLLQYINSTKLCAS